ncbi:unnamed protein product [Cylindrotheca closterium]|uniref:RING-type domain-containing protein n=1 Tax=Cylindrotheca closterium TaxID=2856 RepID=A0AAD2CJF5_9STRA|nr:unnamed protein product [Cylindrotheca closterium]
MPRHILPGVDGDVLHDDTAFVSTALLTLLVLMTTLEAVVLIVCTVYGWFKFPFSDFRWIDEEEENDDMLTAGVDASGKAGKEVDRHVQIADSLMEKVVSDLHGQQECPICLNEFQCNEVVVTPKRECGHAFHNKCLHRWLMAQSSCPCCREKLLEAPVCERKHTHLQHHHSDENHLSSSMVTSSTNDGSIPMSMAMPWTTPEARPSYVPIEEAWGFCLFLF